MVVEHDATVWEISPEGIVMDEKLGEGTFGEVYKGIVVETYNNPHIEGFLKKNNIGHVVVKFLKGGSQFMNVVNMHMLCIVLRLISTCVLTQMVHLELNGWIL